MATVLALHGNGHSSHEYDVVAGALSRRFDVVAWEMPVWADTSIDRLATAAVELLDTRRIEDALLVGSSVGASIAVAVAASHPSRVRGLVLVEPQCRSREWWDTSWPLVDKLFGTVTQSREEIQARFVSPIDDAIVERWNADRARTGAAAMVEVMKAMRAFDLAGAAALVVAPAMALYGAQGPAVDSREALAAAMPGLQSEVIDRCGHFVAIERPDAVVAAVDAVAMAVTQ